MTKAVPGTSTSAIDRLFAPVDKESFLRGYWEVEPLHIQRGVTAHFDDLFSLDAFDGLMTRGDLWHPSVRVFLAGEQLPHERYAARWSYGREVHRRLIDIQKLLELFRGGATINLLGLERISMEVMNLSKELEVEAGFPVHTTAFISPPSAVNVPPHFDMVDVIVAQIHGSKVWNVWQPSRQRPLVTDTAGRPYRHDDSVVSDETHVGRYELRAGDTLYVPRGFLHEAITTTESSLHLAFGINVHRWYDLLEEAARLAVGALADSVEFRKALPVSRAGNSETNGFDGVAEPLERLRQELSRRIEAGLPEALKNLDSRYVGSRASARPNQLLDLERLPSLSPDDSLILRPRLAFGMTTEAERIRLVFHQKRLSLGTALEAPLEYVASGAPFTVRDIPGLSAAKQLTFARTLIAEGFLTFLPVE